jgi:putative hydrolase
MDKSPDNQRTQLANSDVAARFDEMADLLEAQGANPFRVKAYRTAAQTLRQATRPASEILDTEGQPGLERLPGIGHALSRAIEHLVRTGRLPLLERLRGEHAGWAGLTTVGGIGRELAHRIHEQLGIDTPGGIGDGRV